MSEFIPGAELDEQTETTRTYIEEICFEQKDLREDMLFFQLDASNAVDLLDGESIYGDSSLFALVHSFFDFKELNG